MTAELENESLDRQESQIHLTDAEVGVAATEHSRSFDNSGYVGNETTTQNDGLQSEKKETFEQSEKMEMNDENDNLSCGWFNFKPQFIQVLNKPSAFLIFLCTLAVAQSTTVNGLVYVITTTLERRFGLTSAKSGAISSCYDFTVMAVIVFVTYLGENGHKPRWIGIGALLLSMGSWTFLLPHFLTEDYQHGLSDEKTCNNRTLYDACTSGEEQENPNKYYWFFIAAQVLHGLGSAPLYTLGQTFVYENVQPDLASIYLGIFQAASTFAPAIGFVLGGIFLGFYTDINKSPEEIDIESSSPLWVGAWWLGFICTGTLSLLVSVPLLAYPRSLPGVKKYQQDCKLNLQKGSDFAVSASFGGSLRDFPRAMFNLIKNAPFMFINLAVAMENFILACVAVFGPKFVESQFNMSSGSAALLVGLVVIPSSLFGCLFGGWVIKRWKLAFRGQIKFCIVSLMISFLLLFAFLLKCPNVPFAGVTIVYEGNSALMETDLTSPCNENCACANDFDPVCGDNLLMYYSACHAGCTAVEELNGTKTFSNCTCISTDTDTVMQYGKAVQGKCSTTKCGTQPIFFIIIPFVMATTFLIIVPSITSVFEVVAPSQRTTSMGLQSLFYRAFGTVPGPIIFGVLIDKSCLIWEYECDKSRTCWMYENSTFSLYTFLLLFVCRFLSISFFTAALFTYKPSTEVEDKKDTTAGTKA